jgi:ABC-type multidrug transport system fused ATPase/permease subunit
MQDQLMGRVLRRTRFTVVTRLLLAFTFSMGYLMAFVWGGLQLRAGTITFGVMTSFLQLVGQIQHPILSMLNMMPQFFYATASIDRLEELTASAEPVTADDQRQINSSIGIAAHNVSFTYASGDREVLSHFSHDFRSGSKTAIM